VNRPAFSDIIKTIYYRSAFTVTHAREQIAI
jgi:hypothetical protein